MVIKKLMIKLKKIELKFKKKMKKKNNFIVHNDFYVFFLCKKWTRNGRESTML